MGPRSSDRGNFEAQVITGLTQELQWGRDHLIAEMLSALNGLGVNETLQWGRDHLIAEIGHSADPLHEAMGLQWGRDHLIAEIARKDIHGADH